MDAITILRNILSIPLVISLFAGQPALAQTPSLSGSNVWTGPHNNIPETTLTDGASIVPPSSSGSYVLTVGGSGHVIKCPSSIAVVDYVKFGITEGASPVSFDGACYGWVGGVQPTLTANGYDEVYCGSRTPTAGNTANFTCIASINVKAPAPPPPPPPADTWQAAGSAGCNPSVVLSNNALTATIPSSVPGWVACLAKTPHTSGKYFFFETVTAAAVSGNWLAGLGNASTNINSYAGADNNSLAIQISGNGIWFFDDGAWKSVAIPSFGIGTTIRVDFDITNKQLGVNVAGVEYPSGCVITTPANCFDLNGTAWVGGAIYPIFSGSGNGGAIVSTLRTTTGAGPGGGFLLWQ